MLEKLDSNPRRMLGERDEYVRLFEIPDAPPRATGIAIAAVLALLGTVGTLACRSLRS